jgi:hypothetical protein
MLFQEFRPLSKCFCRTKISLDRLTFEISKGYKLKKRLEGDDSSQMLYEETKRFMIFFDY